MRSKSDWVKRIGFPGRGMAESSLACDVAGMAKSLPELEAYRRTSIFDERTIPSGLLRRHTTKAGVWGRIHVLAGELRYRVLEPQVPHEVEPAGSVRFFVEFLRRPETNVPSASESASTREEEPT